MNNLPANIKRLQTQLSKIIQSGGYLGRLLVPQIKNWVIINVLK